MKKITVKDILTKKQRGEKISVLTAYDAAMARVVDEQGIDIILVGDSVGMVMLGYESTIPVTMRDMLHHTRAVSRAVRHALLVADLPMGAYETPELALRNATRLVKQGGAHAVKLEGGLDVCPVVAALSRAGIPVMGHVGLTPQRTEMLGGYKVQGKTPEAADKILQEAGALQAAGAFAVVLECIPASLAERITEQVTIPTIGIGAGPACDGQVLVLHDLIGLSTKRLKFVRRYAHVGDMMARAVQQFKADVEAGTFPTLDESFLRTPNKTVIASEAKQSRI